MKTPLYSRHLPIDIYFTSVSLINNHYLFIVYNKYTDQPHRLMKQFSTLMTNNKYDKDDTNTNIKSKTKIKINYKPDITPIYTGYQKEDN